MPHYAVDTNFFLQFQWPAEIDWSAITGDDEVVLVLLPTIVREIDNHKSAGNGRRARRARKVASIIAEALQTDDEIIPLKDGFPKVLLKLSPPMNVAAARLPWMDSSKPDHEFIAEARAYSETIAELVVLSNDTGVGHTAKHSGLKFKFPPENWQLPPEPDDRDKEINNLRAEVAKHRSNSPFITSRIFGGGSAVSRIQVFTGDLPPLTRDQVEAGVARLRQLYPERKYLETDFSRPFTEGVVSSARVDFETKFRDYLSKLHVYLHGCRMLQALDIEISNESGIQADGVVLDFYADGATTILNRPATAFFLQVPSDPPEPTVMGLHLHTKPIVLPTRDEYKFYWRVRPEEHMNPHASIQCERLRQGTGQNWKVTVAVRTKEGFTGGRLRTVITAKNLPESVEAIYPFEVYETSLSMSEAVARLPFTTSQRDIIGAAIKAG